MRELVALHKHWCIADSVKWAMFHKGSTNEQTHLKQEFGEQWFDSATMISSIWKMSVFYALEYVVIEGYQKAGFQHRVVDELLRDVDSVEKLRLFRHATFHYHSDPLNKKLLGFLEKPGTEDWVKSLHRAFENYFLENMPILEYLSKARQHDDQQHESAWRRIARNWRKLFERSRR